MKIQLRQQFLLAASAAVLFSCIHLATTNRIVELATQFDSVSVYDGPKSNGNVVPGNRSAHHSWHSSNPFRCTNNSRAPECCEAFYCSKVRRSNLYSDCCANTPNWTNVPVHDELPMVYQLHRMTPEWTRIIPVLVSATPRSGTVFLANLLESLGISAGDDLITPNLTAEVMVSWIHGRNDVEHLYYGFANLFGSRFQYMFHFERDPLKALTSMAFTEPLFGSSENDEATRGGRGYLKFLRRHIHFTSREWVKNTFRRRAHYWFEDGQPNPNPDVDEAEIHQRFLLFRGLEFYIQWHQFLLEMKIPRLKLEDLTQRDDFRGLGLIFQALGRPIPSDDIIRQKVEALKNTNSRPHRKVVDWDELCRIAVNLTEDFLDVAHSMGYYQERRIACYDTSDSTTRKRRWSWW